MELDGSGLSMDVEDKDDFDDFTNYLKGRGSVVMNRSGKVTVRVKKAARVQQLVEKSGCTLARTEDERLKGGGWVREGSRALGDRPEPASTGARAWWRGSCFEAAV